MTDEKMSVRYCTGAALCGKHAWPVLVREDPTPNLVEDIYWEGPDEWCAEGSHPIASAYGDPDAPETVK